MKRSGGVRRGIGSLLASAVIVVSACEAVTPPDARIYVVNEDPEHLPQVVRIGVRGDGNRTSQDPQVLNMGDPGALVAWVRVQPDTYQSVTVPGRGRIVAVVVLPDCTIRMQPPWPETGDQPGDPAERPFWIKGGTSQGGPDISGWGMPISESTIIPRAYVERPLEIVDNPCPDLLP